MRFMKIRKKLAKSISYGGTRPLKDIKYIVIHYTGNKGDTAKNNADFFAKSNTREAGAHYFVGKRGAVWESIPMKHIAWAVGGMYTLSGGAGSYYGKCTNGNSVSIELCDCVKKTSKAQMRATRNLVKYIRKHCPNAKTIIRHWDVNGKCCPASMIGKNNQQWKELHDYLK